MSELQDFIIGYLDKKIGDTDNQSSTVITKSYTYSDMKKYISEVKKSIPETAGSVIRVERVYECNDTVYASERWKITQIFYDMQNRPIERSLYKDALYGRVIIAEAIDKELYEFMNGQNQRSFAITSRR